MAFYSTSEIVRSVSKRRSSQLLANQFTLFLLSLSPLSSAGALDLEPPAASLSLPLSPRLSCPSLLCSALPSPSASSGARPSALLSVRRSPWLPVCGQKDQRTEE